MSTENKITKKYAKLFLEKHAKLDKLRKESIAKHIELEDVRNMYPRYEEAYEKFK